MKFRMFFLLFLVINLYAEILIPSSTSQLLVVTSKNFDTKSGVLQAYKKQNDKWIKVKSEVHVNLGRNGLGWGKGMIDFKYKKDEPIKKEGDGKAPAGLFKLSTFFGYQDSSFNFPYIKANKNTLCIDDSSSRFYNQIIQAKSSDFKSFEYMKRKDNLYRYGIVVSHNTEAVKQKGSCIFLHVEKKKNSATAGCTSMEEDTLINLMNWLDIDKKPLLLQLPQEYLKSGFN